MDMNSTDNVATQSIRLIIVFSLLFFLAGRTIGTARFDLDFCRSHRMLVLLRTQRINKRRCGAESARWRDYLLAEDDADFHYEGNFFQRGDIVERIAGDGDDVCLIAGL